jgi:hypothetical protein
MPFEVETITRSLNFVKQSATDRTNYFRRMKVSISHVISGLILPVRVARWLKLDNEMAVGFLTV